MPNVGKSTLFNALLKKQQALVANYPFATIEPNVGIVPVPDKRLAALAEITVEESDSGRGQNDVIKKPPIVPATVQFVDIAGLVKGAAEGAGLGNKFLSHIREVDLICEVVRAFPDDNIIREGSTTPESDIDIIKTELMLADLQTLEKSKDLKAKELMDKLNRGETDFETDIPLLSTKKFIYALNANTGTDWAQVEKLQKTYPGSVCVIDAKLEADLAEFNERERAEYLASLGIKDSGVDQLISLAYDNLGLISFLTAGEKEVRAWTIRRGMTALVASGVIHTDFMENFIKAEVVAYKDFVENGGWKKSRELGRARIEGRDYEMKDGDVVEFKVGV